MQRQNALRSFRQLKGKFVDWNEVRVSSVREIQQEIAATPESLQLAVFIKEFLEFVHQERQDISLEFLAERNLCEIRRYLRNVKGLDSSTVGLILRLRKDYPVFPLNRATETVVERLGIVRKTYSRDRKQRVLHELVHPEKALALHHFLLNHSHEYCPPEESTVDCRRCAMRHMCAFYAHSNSRHRKNSSA